MLVDLKKAYTTVPTKRGGLLLSELRRGVLLRTVRVVMEMYRGSRTGVRTKCGKTDEFEVEVGMHKGSAHSPFLCCGDRCAYLGDQ